MINNKMIFYIPIWEDGLAHHRGPEVSNIDKAKEWISHNIVNKKFYGIEVVEKTWDAASSSWLMTISKVVIKKDNVWEEIPDWACEGKSK